MMFLGIGQSVFEAPAKLITHRDLKNNDKATIQ